MTSSILPPRRLLAPCSPITQARASTTLDLPEPLGPTMQVMPGSSCKVVEDAKDLNPLRVRLFRYNAGSSTDQDMDTEDWGSSARLTLRHPQPPSGRCTWACLGAMLERCGATISPASRVAALAALLAPSRVAGRAAARAPAPVTRAHLLTLADYVAVYPDMRDPLRIVLRSPVFAPRGCEDQGQVVRGTSRIVGSVSPGVRRRSVSLIDQNLVRFDSGPRPGRWSSATATSASTASATSPPTTARAATSRSRTARGCRRGWVTSPPGC